MDAELKAKWVAALRSGKYKQGKGLLRSAENRYCCLGVLCDVMGVKWPKKLTGTTTTVAGKDHFIKCYAVEDRGLGLLMGTREKIGLSDHGVLIEMNDAGKKFTTIANYIEKKL